MMLLASFVLVALAVAEADPQFGHNFNIREPTHNVAPSLNYGNINPGSFFAAQPVAPVRAAPAPTFTQPQFGHNVNFRDPSFFAAQTVAPFQAAPAPPFTQPQGDYYIDEYDNYDYFSELDDYFGESTIGIIEKKKKKKPVQPPNTCWSGCTCTEIGGFCIPADQDCAFVLHQTKHGEHCKPKPTSIGCKCCLKPTVYKQDIENTVAYFLKNLAVYNITTKNQRWIIRILDQTVQKALKNITDTFAQNLPLKTSTVSFLNCLSRTLPTSSRTITGHNLTQIYSSCEKYGAQPKVREWIGCKNYINPGIPKPTWQSFRSYPCGVWTTFHTITVKLANEPKPQQDGTIILKTLHKMVDHFPWCGDCRKHFLSMYNNTALYGGADTRHTSKEAVMWLWRGHNVVTARTAKLVTNPGRSQLQFPGKRQCPQCYGPECPDPLLCPLFNDDQVYNYLKTIYTQPFQ